MRAMEVIGPILVIIGILAMAQGYTSSVHKEDRLACYWDHVDTTACD